MAPREEQIDPNKFTQKELVKMTYHLVLDLREEIVDIKEDVSKLKTAKVVQSNNIKWILGIGGFIITAINVIVQIVISG